MTKAKSRKDGKSRPKRKSQYQNKRISLGDGMAITYDVDPATVPKGAGLHFLFDAIRPRRKRSAK